MSRPRAASCGFFARAGLAAMVVCGAGCDFASPGPAEPEPPLERPDRNNAGLVAFWGFNEGSGDRVKDSVKLEGPAPIELEIYTPGNTSWIDGGLALDAPVRVGTAVRAHVNYGVLASGEVTMEAWVSPAMVSQAGPELAIPGNFALVLALSQQHNLHNALIAQVGDRWHGRILTEATATSGLPAMETPVGTITDTGRVHLAVVGSATDRVLYVNGKPHRASPATGIGRLNAPQAPVGEPQISRWYDYFPLSIGEEQLLSEKRTWLGTIWMAAIYDRALTEAEIQNNFAAGHDCPGC